MAAPTSSASGAAGSAQQTGGNYSSASLYVGDLQRDITEAMLYEVFNSVGPVASIRVCRDTVTRRSLGYAYVNYHSVADAERALDTLNFTHIRNMPCRIMWSHRDPTLRKSGNGNIFVKNLDKTIDNKALYDTFSLFGNILSCKVAQDEFGRSRGFGFVHYETDEAARTATERVNKMQIGNKTVYVGPFIKRGNRQSNENETFTNLYVKNVPLDWTEDDVREKFEKYGTVTSIALQTDMRGRRFGYVNFENPDGAREAVAGLNGLSLTKPDDQTTKDDAGSGAATVDSPNKEDTETKSEGDGEAKEASDEKDAKPDEADNSLFVCRFQSKAERAALLKAKFDNYNTEPRDRRNVGVNLYVKNLHDCVDDARLRELFEPFGQITSAKVMTDSEGVSRGFGFVSYISPDEATKAVTGLHLKLVEAKPLYVALAERKDDRTHRLQQKLRPSHARPRMAPMPHQLQFGPPTGMSYGGVPHDNAMSGYPAQMPRGPMTGYPQPMPMVGWNRDLRHPAGSMRGMQPGVPPAAQVGGMTPAYPSAAGITPSAAAAMAGQPQAGGAGQLGPNMGTYAGAGHPGDLQRRMMHPNPAGAMAGPGAAQAMHMGGGSMMSNETHPHSDMQDVQKQFIGEQLFPRIASLQPKLAGKITGMMLDMDNQELNRLLDSEAQLKDKVEEALRVLRHAQDAAAESAT